MSNQVSQMDVQFSPFPLGYCPTTLNEMWTAGAARLTVTPGLGFYGINIGPVAPENTDIPWFNTTENDWYYWSTVSGSWLPVRPTSVTGEVQIGTVIDWDGQISMVSAIWGDKWLFADGSIVAISDYPDYFSLIGNKWGGDGLTTFGIIDARNYFKVGADADVGGQATSTISDGVTPSIQRPYTTHVHAGGASSIAAQGKNSGNSYTGIEISATSDAVTGIIATRVLPPYKVTVPVVRVK